MCRIDEPKRKFGADLRGLPDRDRLEELHAVLGVEQRVERQSRAVLGGLRLVVVGRVFFLQMSGVGEHHGTQLNRSLGGVDRAVESFFDQARNPAAVVEVRVGKNDGIDFAGGHRRVLPVFFAPFLLSLKHSAIDQDLQSLLATRIGGGVDEVLGAGDGAGGAEKLNIGQMSLREMQKSEVRLQK